MHLRPLLRIYIAETLVDDLSTIQFSETVATASLLKR